MKKHEWIWDLINNSDIYDVDLYCIRRCIYIYRHTHTFERILYCAIADTPVSGGKHRCPMTNDADALVHTKQRGRLNLKHGAEA